VDAPEVLAELDQHGMLLESARGPLPNVAELVAGEPMKGSWWGHPQSHTIFEVINRVADSPDVVRLRLVKGKVTLVHRRLWPALARVAEGLPAAGLAALHEQHTESGAHRVVEQPFPEWLPADVVDAAAELSTDEAWARLPECVQGLRER
jgi:hypothetical protein